MSRSIKKGATSQTVYVEILDSTSSTGGRKTGLAFNTSSLAGYYVRNGGSAVAITLATLAAANSAWSSGGFKEVDATNMPGIYRLDVPDAALITGAESVVITLKGATGMAQVSVEIQLSDNNSKDVYDRLGAPAGASVSADVAVVAGYIDTEVAAIKAKTDSLTFTSAGKVDANVLAVGGDATSATNLAKTTKVIGRGTVSGSPSTTSIPTSAFTPAGAAADQFKGRIITFDADTTTTALRGQSTDITASSNASTPTFTVTALTTAPSSGDTFSVT